jgi:hypothetical protein
VTSWGRDTQHPQTTFGRATADRPPFGPTPPQQVNELHTASDVDGGPLSQHHTLGLGQVQASAGDHVHDGLTSLAVDSFTGVTSVRNRRFGAKGDGVADDTLAVQKAIDAGGITFFPPGTYLVGTLVLPNGAVLAGADQSGYQFPVGDARASVLVLKPATNGYLLSVPVGAGNVQIRNLGLDGNSAAQSAGNGIDIAAAGVSENADTHIVDCYIVDCKDNGIRIGANRTAVRVTRTLVMAAGTANLVVAGSDAVISGCLFGLAGVDNVRITDAWVTRLECCDIWSGGQLGVKVYGDSHMTSIVGCGIDRNNQHGIYVADTAEATSVTGCLLHSNSQQTNNTWSDITMASAGALTVAGCVFDTDPLPNKPAWGIEVQAGTVLTAGNIHVPGATVNGKLSTGPRNPLPFTALALTGAGFGNQGAPYDVLGYAKDDSGVVRLRGVTTMTTGRTAGQVLATLPAGHRPTAQKLYALPTGAGPLEFEVKTNGDLIIRNAYGGGATYTSWDGVTFATG